MIRCAFTDAIGALAAGALVTRRRESDWCSVAVIGKRIVLDLLWQGSDEKLQDFLIRLPDYEFLLPGMFVAEIAGSKHGLVDGRVPLTIEALLLHEDT